MGLDLDAAASFLATHGRLLDRRRYAALLDPSPSRTDAVLGALAGYRNDDGGYGWGLEPDLRAPESQPAAALHALEAIADVAHPTTPAITRVAVELFDWLDTVTLGDGGLPFALPISHPAACAPFWVEADHHTSSLQISAAVAAQAHRAVAADAEAAGHPWLARITDYCLAAIANLDEAPSGYVLSFALQFLDAASDRRPEAAGLLAHLAHSVPGDGAIPVEGGAAGETLHLLDFAAEQGRPVRDLVTADAVAADLHRLENGQQPDGGWAVDFTSYSPAAAMEWRGHATVRAVGTVLRHRGHAGSGLGSPHG